MNENQYIYSRLKFHSDEIDSLIGMCEQLVENQGKILNLVEKLTEKVNEVSNPDYIKKANQHNDMKDVLEKINYFRNLNKKENT